MPNIPLASLGLNLPNITFQHGAAQVTRPITDHPPIIQNTLWGAIATINILNPGSPLAPPAQVNGVTTLPPNGQAQMEEMAEYIFKMFQQGVGLLALQEVPPPGTANFNYLLNKLTALNATSNLIDVSSLSSHWLQTGTHEFGTTILTNPNQFKLAVGARADLNNRAGVYSVTAQPSGQIIPVVNIHGDFKNQQGTAAYANHFDGLCLGDLNISQTTMRANPNPQVLQSIEAPSIVVEGLIRQARTVDFIQDTYSKKFSPTFTPSTTAITPTHHTPQPIVHHNPTPVPPTPTPIGHTIPPVVFTVAKDQAVEFLRQFKGTLPSALITMGGKIEGLQLTTPSPYTIAHITISNSKVYEAILPFYNNWVKQQQDALTQVNDNTPPVINRPSTPVVAAIEILAAQAAGYVEQLKRHLPPRFHDQSPIGIIGVEIEMPQPGKTDARITFKNKEIYDFIARGFRHEEEQQEHLQEQQVQETTQHSSSSRSESVVPPVITAPVFQHQVIKIAKEQASGFLDRVKTNLPPQFIQHGRIKDVELKTPKNSETAEITIKNKEVYQAILPFYEQWKQQQATIAADDTQSTTTQHSSISHSTHVVSPVTDVSSFQAVVIKIPAQQAASFLDRARVEANLPPELIRDGRIIDIELKTPRKSAIAEITIKNRAVHQAIAPFYEQWMKEQQKKEQETIDVQQRENEKNNVPPIIEQSTVDTRKKDGANTTTTHHSSESVNIQNQASTTVTKVQLFNDEKQKIQAAFIQKLNEFSTQVKRFAEKDPSSAQKGEELYNTLMKAQAAFFQSLTPESSEMAIKAQISDFRVLCKNHFSDADKVMGHGWLYRAAEVLIKAVVGLFAAIGMVLGVVVGQGLASADHRQKFSNTFFALDKTEGTKALETTQQQILGSDNDQGLLDEEAFTPKK